MCNLAKRLAIYVNKVLRWKRSHLWSTQALASLRYDTRIFPLLLLLFQFFNASFKKKRESNSSQIHRFLVNGCLFVVQCVRKLFSDCYCCYAFSGIHTEFHLLFVTTVLYKSKVPFYLSHARRTAL